VGKQQRPKMNPDWIVRATDLADFFQVERSTIHTWKTKGMPTFGDRFYMPQCIAWFMCFGPGRSEASRDERLWMHIRSLTELPE